MLGQALSLELRRAGHPVGGFARANADFNIDATNDAMLLHALTEFDPAIVVNAAAITSLDACERDPGGAYRVNARLPAVLANFCGGRGRRLVQISTDHYFDGDGRRRHDELAPVTLKNEYARTKFAGEAFASTCPDHLVVRTNIVGFRGWPDRPTFLEWALKALRASEPMTLYDDFHTSSLDVTSFAAVLRGLLALPTRGLLNVAARDVASKREFILGLAGRLGLDTTACRDGSVRSLAGVPRAASLGLDVTEAERILNHALPDTNAVLDVLARQYEERKS
jgi:dTDP-4-dehydrorhamnose reductase